MANWTSRRRSATRRSSTNRASSSWSNRRRSSSWGTGSYTWGRSNSTRSSAQRSRRTTGSAGNYAAVRAQFDQKIQSFQALRNQTQGGTASNRPSPSTLVRWANYVNKGAVVFRVSGQKIARTARTGRPCNTAGAAFKALRSRYGSAIKAVTQDKSGSWLVAANPQSKGKSFKFAR